LQRVVTFEAFGIKNFIDSDHSIIGGWAEKIAIRAAAKHRTETAMVLC
jgi:hypothetical protein